MPDSLGQRAKFAVLAPSTNTSVQPEFDAMRPWGVTNHHSRLVIPDSKVTDDASFLAMMNNIRAALIPALEAALTCKPDYVVLGMSSETFWDGLKGALQLRKKLERKAKRGIAMGSDACRAALRAYGRGIRRLGVITPYMPVGDRQVRRFFGDCGYEIVNLLGLKCASPVQIAHVSRKALRDAIHQVNRGHVRVLARQAGDRHQHRDLLVRAARLRHQGPRQRLGLAARRALSRSTTDSSICRSGTVQ